MPTAATAGYSENQDKGVFVYSYKICSHTWISHWPERKVRENDKHCHHHHLCYCWASKLQLRQNSTVLGAVQGPLVPERKDRAGKAAQGQDGCSLMSLTWADIKQPIIQCSSSILSHTHVFPEGIQVELRLPAHHPSLHNALTQFYNWSRAINASAKQAAGCCTGEESGDTLWSCPRRSQLMLSKTIC